MTHYPTHSRIYNIKADSLITPKDETSNKTLHKLPANPSAKLKPSVNENSVSLTGLLAHYNSDSEQEDTNGLEPSKLDAKVDDFLQEINQLAPTNVSEQRNKKDVTVSSGTYQKPNTVHTIIQYSTAWQECFDESTGYPYYWNIETNAVTWEMPQEYRDSQLHKSVITSKVQEKPTIQPEKVEVPIKDLNSKQVSKETFPQKNRNKTVRKTVVKKSRRPSNDSEDERIVMITSFSEGSGSESDNEKSSGMQTKKSASNFSMPDQPLVVMGPHAEDIPEQVSQTAPVPASANDANKKEIIELVKEENIDETVILSRLRTQAKVLQELGGELPMSVDKSIICSDRADLADNSKPQSLALVAGYGDDSEPEDEPTTATALFPIPCEPKDVNLEPHQSTLFPVTEPIDVKQFEVPVTSEAPPVPNVPKDPGEESVIDNKVFKRKKRLDIAFGVPVLKQEKRLKVEEPGLELDVSGDGRKGLGFQEDTDSNSNEEVVNEKIPLKKSGIAFVKANIFGTAEPIVKATVLDTADIEDFQEVKAVVTEKVQFLGEGKPLVSPVQIMSIQLQTLEAAYKASGLSQRYLYTWLRETFTELGKLEQEAAPEGWQCQWDRSNKRYFYRNQQTGHTQWEYPESDIVGGGEAMDICTTPPPANDDQAEVHSADLVASPSPAAGAEDHVSSPPPPPAVVPAIDAKENKATNSKEHQAKPASALVLDVAPPPPSALNVSENQPLPPGVDSPDLPYSTTELKETNCTEVNKSTGKDALGSELDSFYSDIAMLEAATISSTDMLKPNTNSVPSPSSIMDNAASNDIVVKKKKKLKSKLGQGINMKKKAVSSLVEKWKKVQNDYL